MSAPTTPTRLVRAWLRLRASPLTRYPSWPATRMTRSRTSRDTLAPGVKARDTAERETPARRATSAAVMKGRAAGDCLIRGILAHVCRHYSAECTRVQAPAQNQPALRLSSGVLQGLPDAEAFRLLQHPGAERDVRQRQAAMPQQDRLILALPSGLASRHDFATLRVQRRSAPHPRFN